MNHVSIAPHPAVLRYSNGEVSATEAACLIGGDTTAHDVIFQLREAGLPLPPQMRTVNQAAVGRALKLLGPAQ